MKSDVHLIGSESPLSATNVRYWGRPECGKILKAPKIAFMFDEIAMGESFRENLKGVCRKCLAGIGTERYVYGILAGQ